MNELFVLLAIAFGTGVASSVKIVKEKEEYLVERLGEIGRASCRER